ncbi:hypothetical protein F4810DRAFT_684116 [Camillea tinctor]|nr:hypothetical protein F4810DRAFT_684116 [Camillea tinctor]
MELCKIYLLQGSLAAALDCHESAKGAFEKHCPNAITSTTDLELLGLSLRIAQWQRSQEATDTSTTNGIYTDINTFLKSLDHRFPPNHPIMLSCTRKCGFEILKLGRWNEGRATLLRAIKGYEDINSNGLEAAFANKDMADGFLSHSQCAKRDVFHILNQAGKYYMRSKYLFDGLNSVYSDKYNEKIEEKLQAIERERVRLEKREL